MITNVRRYATEKITSVEDDLLSYQHGTVASIPNATSTFIANPFKTVASLDLTPVKLGTTSANGVALFTTAVGYEVETLSATVNDLPAYTNGTVYQAGVIVKDGGKAYLCIEAHTAGATKDASKFIELSTTKFIKITHTAAGTGKVVNCLYTLTGYYY